MIDKLYVQIIKAEDKQELIPGLNSLSAKATLYLGNTPTERLVAPGSGQIGEYPVYNREKSVLIICLFDFTSKSHCASLTLPLIWIYPNVVIEKDFLLFSMERKNWTYTARIRIHLSTTNSKPFEARKGDLLVTIKQPKLEGKKQDSANLEALLFGGLDQEDKLSIPPIEEA